MVGLGGVRRADFLWLDPKQNDRFAIDGCDLGRAPERLRKQSPARDLCSKQAINCGYRRSSWIEGADRRVGIA
jgi:hypothetical protein